MATTIDEVLEILHRTGPDLVGGNSNHAPMVAEALFAMGRPEAVIPWIEGYQSRFQERPAPHGSISHESWHEALGERGYGTDWVTFFDHELAATPWPVVLQQWVPRLAPGLMAAAAHGLIRTSHAVRSLAAQETAPRLHELAEGLGYWAARYQELPGRPSQQPRGYTPCQALPYVQRVHGPDFDASGAIVQNIKGLDAQPEFADAIDLVDTTDDLADFIAGLTTTFAAVYLANPKGLIAFVHAVTAPSALRLLTPYVDEADARLAARYAWQACAAIYAWYATTTLPATTHVTPPMTEPDKLIDRAVMAGGAHTIKFTEVCLREYALTPQAIYLVAAYDAADRVGKI
jgi:Questin oxidase-like